MWSEIVSVARTTCLVNFIKMCLLLCFQLQTLTSFLLVLSLVDFAMGALELTNSSETLPLVIIISPLIRALTFVSGRLEASLPYPRPMYMFTLYQLVKFRIYLLTYMYLKPIYALRQMLSVQLELSFSRGVCGGVGGQFCPTLIDNSFFKQTGSPCIYWQFQVRKQSFHEDI